MTGPGREPVPSRTHGTVRDDIGPETAPEGGDGDAGGAGRAEDVGRAGDGEVVAGTNGTSGAGGGDVDPLAAAVGRDRAVVLFTARWAVAATLLTRGGHTGGADVVVDVDDHPDLADRYQVTTVPEVLILTDGDVRQRIRGADVVDTLTGRRPDHRNH